ncbi:hypothetical protein [Poriferisphaera sp. WC338]|uniref:hypothetical protein n=1 Tax=Poriferisphaera sp. WC338 TaxID=3425129 RepID=UPI003D815C8F
MITLKTIREGERAAVWNMAGKVKYIDGPKRLWLFRETFESLTNYSAEADQYLAVRFTNGDIKHIHGPAAVWLDPVLHANIEIKPLIPINANEAVVIYQRTNKQEVNRRILQGPAQYMPEPNEWLHRFSWHGADPNNPKRKKPSALAFTKLRVIPDQMYFDVQDVRTADDALLTVQLMIFFEIIDIERMLDQTHDPVADFINAVTADIIDFAASRLFEKFKQDTEKLNNLEAYNNLITRAKRIGYQVNKVVYRGYEANPKLQAMHDHAIETRTALQLEAETEQQAQELADLKLAREADREKQQRELEHKRTEHDQLMKQLAHQQVIKQNQAEHKQKMEFEQESNILELKHLHEKNTERANYLKQMKEMQIDLTQYLVAQYQNPDRLIRIDGPNGDNPQLHLHE